MDQLIHHNIIPIDEPARMKQDGDIDVVLAQQDSSITFGDQMAEPVHRQRGCASRS